LSYVEDNLLPNERVVYMARIHPAIFLPVAAIFLIAACFLALGASSSYQGADSSLRVGVSFGVCGAAVVALAGLWAMLQLLVFVMSTEFGLTDRRIIAKRGLIRRRSLELLLTKVESVHVNQDLLGRIFDFGTVTITGTGGTRERFPAISNPLKLRRLIHEQIEALLPGGPAL
jgi:uncharacterized membrane protein YdbT with pleckstrin-like domain